MAKLTELGDLSALRDLKERFEKSEAEERERIRKEREEEHRRTHIFSSYDRALDYLVDNPGHGISWHTKSIYWDAEKQMFEVFDQEFDVSGVVPYDVHYFTTREKLLQEHQDFCEWRKNEYKGEDDDTWYLDKYGKLEYVYAYNPPERCFKHY